MPHSDAKDWTLEKRKPHADLGLTVNLQHYPWDELPWHLEAKGLMLETSERHADLRLMANLHHYSF